VSPLRFWLAIQLLVYRGSNVIAETNVLQRVRGFGVNIRPS